MKRATSICVLVTLWTGSAAFATTTSQIWYFHSNDTTPGPDYSANPFGTAELHIEPGPAAYPYWEVIDGRLGVWALSGEIDVIVPNNPTIRPWKEIIIDLVWAPADSDAFVPNEPLVGVSAAPMEAMEMSAVDELLSGDWHHTRYDITIWPNPPEEWITEVRFPIKKK